MFCFRIVRIMINSVLASLASNCTSTILYYICSLLPFEILLNFNTPYLASKDRSSSIIRFAEFHNLILWIWKKIACKVLQECFITKKTKRIFYNLSFWIENSGIVRSGENSKTPTKIFSNTFIYPPLSCFSFLLQLWNEKKWFEMRIFILKFTSMKW